MAVLARLQKSPVDPCRQEEDSSSEHRNMCSITLMDDNPPADAKNGQCSRDCHHSKNEDETGMVEVIMNPKLCHDPTTSTSSSSSSAENRSPGDNSGRSASGSKQKSPFKEDSDKEESVQISVTALFTKNTSKTGDDGKPSREETVIVTNSTSSVITTDSTTVSQVKHWDEVRARMSSEWQYPWFITLNTEMCVYEYELKGSSYSSEQFFFFFFLSILCVSEYYFSCRSVVSDLTHSPRFHKTILKTNRLTKGKKVRETHYKPVDLLPGGLI